MPFSYAALQLSCRESLSCLLAQGIPCQTPTKGGAGHSVWAVRHLCAGLGYQVATAPTGVLGQFRPWNVTVLWRLLHCPASLARPNCFTLLHGLRMLMRPLHTKHHPSSANCRHMIVRLLPTFWGATTNPSSQPDKQTRHQDNWRRTRRPMLGHAVHATRSCVV